jgi:hypothetical protein
MALIKLNLVAADIDTVRESFDRMKAYRSTTGIDGTYTEITTPATRPVLEAGKAIYEYVDENGHEDYYYRFSYFNTLSALESSLSDPQQGEGDSALGIITVEEIKQNYLFGLDLTNDKDDPLPNALYEFFIKSAVSWLEHRLDLPLRPKRIEAEAHDFIKEDYDKYIALFLDQYPVIDVEDVRLVLPGEQVVQVFEREWFQLEKEMGQLHLVPGTGTAGSILLGATGAWIPYIYGANKFIPRAFRITYTAGFESGKVPAVLKDMVGKVASYGPLNILGDLIAGAGIANLSLSIDGLSQTIGTTSSATNSGYGARLVQYTRELKDAIPTMQWYYKGIRLKVV